MNYTFKQEYAAIAANFPATNLPPKPGFPIVVISNAITKIATRETYFKVRKALALGATPARATVYGTDGETSISAENYRKTDIFPVELIYQPEITTEQINGLIKEVVAKTFGIENLVPISNWWLAGYGVGDKFDQHCDGAIRLPDGNYKAIEDRLISAILYINPKDDNTTGWGYTGGSLTFPGIIDEAGKPLTINPKEGDLVIFPSSWIYSHAVTPVTSGYRLAATNFFKLGSS
jgi:predicted 2-oxoglutarate/Fe(II)-dependent dioxygenase YbiX